MSATGWAVVLAVLLATTLVLGAFVLLLERPRHLGRFARTRRWFVGCLGACVIAVLGVVVGQGDPTRIAAPSSAPAKTASLATVLRLVGASNTIHSVPADLAPSVAQAVSEPYWNLGEPPGASGCVITIPASTAPACIFGDLHGTHTMVLYGDSHAGMWFAALDDIAKRAHWRLVVLFKSACPAALLSTRAPGTTVRWLACDSWHAYAVRRIRSINPDLLIVTQNPASPPNGTGYNSTQWQQGLEELIRRTASPTTDAIVLGDIPPSRGPNCLAQHVHDVQACSTSVAAHQPYSRAEKRAAAAEGARYVSVTPWFCARSCSPIIGTYNVYFSAGHVALDYSRFLEGVLAQKLNLASF